MCLGKIYRGLICFAALIYNEDQLYSNSVIDIIFALKNIKYIQQLAKRNLKVV